MASLRQALQQEIMYEHENPPEPDDWAKYFKKHRWTVCGNDMICRYVHGCVLCGYIICRYVNWCVTHGYMIYRDVCTGGVLNGYRRVQACICVICVYVQSTRARQSQTTGQSTLRRTGGRGVAIWACRIYEM